MTSCARPAHRPPLSGLPVAVALALAMLCLGAPRAHAVPSFAAQTGQPCQACHVGGFGPQLTPFGREFKLRGYTMRSVAFAAPISVMAVASYVRTQDDQAAPPADGFHRNDNGALDQASLFLAGGLGAHFGGFVQTTYDGVDKSWAWDNLDLRAVTTAQIKGADVLLGASLNNAPGVQDAWNTLPAWGYPYTDSALAPAPAAAPLMAGGLAQNSLGLSGYAWINSKVYLEAGGYWTPDRKALSRLGGDPFSPGDIDGLAPYGRVALQRDVGGGVLEVGASGLGAEIHPGGDRSTAAVDRYTDLGLDASYFKTLASGDTVTLNGRYIHEREALEATCALAAPGAGCADSHLNDLRFDAAYHWRNGIGATVAAFDTFGPVTPLLYPDHRTLRPDSSGLMLQLDGTPYGAGNSPLGPRFNLRVGVQYTHYARFDGARRDYDGAGAKASDNDTARVFAWVAF